MRYIKKFYESKIDSYKYEILRHPGWVEVDPPKRDHWDFQLEFELEEGMYGHKLSKPIKITVICLDNKTVSGKLNINYYMGENMNFINGYDNNYTLTFTNVYDNYERMMEICKYNSVFFDKEPNEKTIDGVKECFIDLIDLSDEFNFMWGWSNGSEHDFLPAFRFSDSLKLVLRLTIPNGNEDDLSEIFEDNKDKLQLFFDDYKVEYKYDKYYFDIIIGNI